MMAKNLRWNLRDADQKLFKAVINFSFSDNEAESIQNLIEYGASIRFILERY